MSKPRKGKAAHKQGKQQFGEETEDVPDTDDHSFPWRSLDFVQLDALWSDNVQDFDTLDLSKEKGCTKYQVILPTSHSQFHLSFTNFIDTSTCV